MGASENVAKFIASSSRISDYHCWLILFTPPWAGEACLGKHLLIAPLSSLTKCRSSCSDPPTVSRAPSDSRSQSGRGRLSDPGISGGGGKSELSLSDLGEEG